MKGKVTKSKFTGFRMTAEQERLLLKLKESGNYKTYTDVLLSGLEALAGLNKERTTKEVIAKLTRVEEILEKYQNNKSALIQILLDIQEEFSWLPKETLLWLSDRLKVPLSRLYEIATFYKVFSLVPRGRNSIKVCTGTACHVRGAPALQNRVTQLLGINPGETTQDLRFSFDTVNCLGCCALGPVIVINNEYYSNPTTAELEKLFNECH